MIATIGVEGLEIRCIVGVLPHEREAEQTLLVDVEIDRSIAAAVASEDVADTVDYVAIADDVTSLAVEGRFQLLETLADRALDLLLERFGAERAAIKIMKPAAIAAARHATVRLERSRS